jgi:2-polyprenyl-6-methoxyphenol hydroxylase-like FAD-dependent oxidoreductase
MKQLQMDEENVRLLCEKPRDLGLNRDGIKAIVIEKMQMEFDSEKRLATVQARSQQQAQQIVMFERTKIMDQVYMKHGIKLAEMQSLHKEHDLDNDEDIKALKNSNLAAREQI